MDLQWPCLISVCPRPTTVSTRTSVEWNIKLHLPAREKEGPSDMSRVGREEASKQAGYGRQSEWQTSRRHMCLVFEVLDA